MAGRGPAPKPIEVKRRLGNPGKRALPNPVTTIAPLTVIRTATRPADGAALVDALLEAGAAAWIGETDQLALLRMLQEGWDRRARLVADIAANGGSYESRGRWYPRPEVTELAELEKRITTWLSQLGLNPADRGRLGLAQVKARSKLEELRDRRTRALQAGRPAG